MNETLQEALLEEQKRLKTRLREEEQLAKPQNPSSAGSGVKAEPGTDDLGPATSTVVDMQEDPLDAYMTDMKAALEQSKVIELHAISRQFIVYRALHFEYLV